MSSDPADSSHAAPTHGSGADAVSAAAARIITHMNDDHADAQFLFCSRLGGVADVVAARMVAVDTDGFDMIATTPSGDVPVRLAFPAPCTTALAVREAMVTLVARAGDGETQ